MTTVAYVLLVLLSFALGFCLATLHARDNVKTILKEGKEHATRF